MIGQLLRFALKNAASIPKLVSSPLLKVLFFKNVSLEWKATTGEPRPTVATRRWTGFIGLLLSSLWMWKTGVQIDANFLTSIQNNIDGLLASLSGLWSAALLIYGTFRAGR